MDIDDDILDAFFALIGLSMFFIFATLGGILASLNEDSHLFIEYKPEEDAYIISGLLLFNLCYMAWYLIKAFAFRRSKSLDKRYGELLLNSDKMMIYSVPFLALEIAIIYYYVKYFKTSIAVYMFLVILFEISLVILIFYNSIRIRRDYREELENK